MQEKIKKYLILGGNPHHMAMVQKYFKGGIKSYGIKMTDAKKIINNLYANEIKFMDIQSQIDMSVNMLKSDFLEERISGIYILEKLLKRNLDINFLRLVEKQKIIENYIYDWGSCDIFSSKIFAGLILKDDECINIIKKRKDSNYLWKQRSACISFVKLGKKGIYNDHIREIASQTIKNPERFVQLGTGWVLREMSVSDLERAEQFLFDNFKFFGREGLRYAIEKMSESKRKFWLNYKAI